MLISGPRAWREGSGAEWARVPSRPAIGLEPSTAVGPGAGSRRLAGRCYWRTAVLGGGRLATFEIFITLARLAPLPPAGQRLITHFILLPPAPSESCVVFSLFTGPRASFAAAIRGVGKEYSRALGRLSRAATRLGLLKVAPRAQTWMQEESLTYIRPVF